MAGNSLHLLICSVLLIICMISAGCSDESPAPDTPNTTTTAPVAQYSEGDIVATPSSSGSSSLYLILKYDPVTDLYTRAVINKNADGSWGYRSSGWSERVPRATLERTYTVRAGHVAVAIVPVVTDTVRADSTSPPALGPPEILTVSPSSGVRDSAVNVVIGGNNFQNGAVVKLYQAGSLPRNATVMSVTTFRISCVFSLSGLNTGRYNIIVINPDSRSDSREAAFTIGEAAPVIASVYPATGAMNARIPVTISGQNFRTDVKVMFANATTELVCDNPLTTGSEQILCTLDLSSSRGASPGEWNVTILNIRDGTSGTWVRDFTILNSTPDT